MQEYSRILIEVYCMTNDSANCRRLEKLVEVSYDIYSEGADDNVIF